jgi:hypothetical protein
MTLLLEENLMPVRVVMLKNLSVLGTLHSHYLL